MIVLWLTALLLLVYVTGTNEPFVLNRVSVTKNTAKHFSVRFHAQSPELLLIHAILRFNSPINTRHNALLIEQSSLAKYQKIMNEDEMKMTITSRNIKKVLPYHTVQENTTNDANGDGIADKLAEVIRSASLFGLGLTASVSYDGVLLLDEYSAIWNTYNVMVFSTSMLTFLYSKDGSLSTLENTVFNGVTRFMCDPTYDADQCLVVSEARGLQINGFLYPTYRILVDLDARENLLPIDLFLRWRTTEPHLSITVGEDSVLHLNRDFVYSIHQSNVIVLGVDLIHYFPRVEYSVTHKEFAVFFNHAITVDSDTQHTIAVLFVFLNWALLVCLFLFGTSFNYSVLNYIIMFGNYAKTAHFFAFKQVFVEGATIIIVFVVIIVSLVVDDADPAWTAYESRKALFIGFLVYHMVMTIFINVVYVEHARCALRHYFARLCPTTKQPVLITPLTHRELDKDVHSIDAILPLRQRKFKPLELDEEPFVALIEPLPYSEAFMDIKDRKLAQRLHNTVVGMYHDPVIQLYTPISIIRNLAFMTTLLVGLALLFNFYTPTNNIYLLLIVALSFAIIYYQVKYLAVAVVYLSLFYPCRMTQCEWRANKWLILFMVVESAVVILYIVCSYESIYVAYFDTINTTHSVSTINAYILSVIATVVLLAVMSVTIAFDKYADPLIEDVIEERLKLRCMKLKKINA